MVGHGVYMFTARVLSSTLFFCPLCISRISFTLKNIGNFPSHLFRTLPVKYSFNIDHTIPVISSCGGCKNFENRCGRQFISSVLIYRKAHNEIYAFYTEKIGFLKKNSQ